MTALLSFMTMINILRDLTTVAKVTPAADGEALPSCESYSFVLNLLVRKFYFNSS